MGVLRENLEKARGFATTVKEPASPQLPERVHAAAEKWAGEALVKRLEAIRDTCSGSTFQVLKDLEHALRERTEQLANLHKNYDGLHNICEEYHLQIETLRGQAATQLDNEEAFKASKREVAELTARLAETSGLQSQLDAALLQLAAANEQLATQNAALQESAKARQRLQAAAKAAETKAAAASDAMDRCRAAQEGEAAALAASHRAEVRHA